MTTVTDARVQRVARLRWVPIAQMKVNPKAQREFNPAQAEKYAADFDFEGMGFPVLNLRDGSWYIVDGQHRIAALKLIGYGDQQVQCECFEGLTEAQEADLFLVRDDRRKVSSFERFGISVTAGRETQVDVNRIVQSLGLCVSQQQVPGAIGSATTLVKVYERGGPQTLARTLKKPVSTIHQKAETIRSKTGTTKTQAVAAAVVDIFNAGKGGKKLPSWWAS
jgi:hypothetical protein